MWCRVTYRIEVPRDLDIEVNADNGRVEVSNVDGELVIDSDNGAIELADLSGSIAVDGDNGSIIGTDLSSSGHRRRVGQRTHRVGVHRAARLRWTPVGTTAASRSSCRRSRRGYDVTADSSNGGDEILVNDNPESPHKLRLETDNGSITVRAVADVDRTSTS